MKFAKKLLVLTLLLAFVMVIPSVALAQDYNLSGEWSLREIEVANDFSSGDHETEPQNPYAVCVCHYDTDNSNDYFNIEIYNPDNCESLYFVGGTGSYFIGFGSANPEPSEGHDAWTGRINEVANRINGKFIYSQYKADYDDAHTGLNFFSMEKVSDDCDCCPSP